MEGFFHIFFIISIFPLCIFCTVDILFKKCHKWKLVVTLTAGINVFVIYITSCHWIKVVFLQLIILGGLIKLTSRIDVLALYIKHKICIYKQQCAVIEWITCERPCSKLIFNMANICWCCYRDNWNKTVKQIQTRNGKQRQGESISSLFWLKKKKRNPAHNDRSHCVELLRSKLCLGTLIHCSINT